MTYALIFFAAYLLGSIPFGLLLTRLAGLGDIRNVGSGNIGATNVLRTGNKKLAALTLLLDGFKGYAAVLLAVVIGTQLGLTDQQNALVAGSGLAALMGHIFPVWLKFKGGRGVATAFGVALAFSALGGVYALLTWLVVALLFRISSLAALVSIAALPLYGWLMALPIELIAALALMALLVIYRHTDNIKRLLAGTEPKIGQKK